MTVASIIKASLPNWYAWLLGHILWVEACDLISWQCKEEVVKDNDNRYILTRSLPL